MYPQLAHRTQGHALTPSQCGSTTCELQLLHLGFSSVSDMFTSYTIVTSGVG